MTTSPVNLRALGHPAVLWASVFGVGMLKPAPGTWGSVAAVVFWWLILADLSLGMQLLICVGYFLTAWWASAVVCARFNVADAPQIVADEVVGMWLALAFCPQVWWLVLPAFLLFRLLDVAKPGPIGWLDREVHGGLGVMLDDVLAGAIAGCVIWCSVWVIRAMGISVDMTLSLN